MQPHFGRELTRGTLLTLGQPGGAVRNLFLSSASLHQGGLRLDIVSAAQPHCTPRKGHKGLAARSQARRTLSDRRNRRFVALQPIFDRDGGLFGYEALYRTGPSNWFAGDPRKATQSIVRDWLLDGLYKFTGGKPVFLNCTREDLMECFVTLPPVPIVVEVLETVEIDESILDECGRLKASGLQIALDDFELCRSDERLMELADYVKIDFRMCDKAQRQEIFRCIKKESICFIAEKIETPEEFEEALGEGFDLFQGYFLAHPFLLSKPRSYLSWLNHFRVRWWSRQRRGRRR